MNRGFERAGFVWNDGEKWRLLHSDGPYRSFEEFVCVCVFNTSFIFKWKNCVGIQSILLMNIIFKIKIIWVNYK